MPFDVNGRPVSVPRWRRVLARATTDLTIGDPDLVPVASSRDDAAASSAVLGAAERFDPQAQAALWHLLELPVGAVAEVLALVRQDRYERLEYSPEARPADGGPAAGTGSGTATGERELVAVARVQLVDAMHLSQERSRMASVAARHGGDALQWRVLQIVSDGRQIVD